MDECLGQILLMKLKKSHWIQMKVMLQGIDLGCKIIYATIVTTEGTPCIVDGRKLKNQIILQNVRKHAHYKSILDKQGRKNIQQAPKNKPKIQKHTKQLPQPNSKFHHRKNAKNTTQEQQYQDTTKISNSKAIQEKNKTNIFSHIAYKHIKVRDKRI